MPVLEVGTGHPYSTVQAAVTDAPDGGNVRVNAGGVGNAYAEAVVVNNKRVRLVGSLADQGASITGAGGGAASALAVTGTGGVFVENLTFSNVGSAGAYVVEMNVAEDWISRCVIDGGGTKTCLQFQFGDNCLLRNGTSGSAPSCPGQTLAYNFTVVNMSVNGLVGNATTGWYVACLAYNCNNLAYVNHNLVYSTWLFSDDATATAPGSIAGMSLADIAFADYAGGDFRLLPTSKAFAKGIPFTHLDLPGNRRAKGGSDPRIFGGCHDPWPGAPTFATGSAQLRGF